MTDQSTQAMLLRRVTDALEVVAIPERAAKMQAYMKSSVPFMGVPMDPLRRACRQVFAAHKLSSSKQWHQDVLYLWDHATYREQRYAAMVLTADKRALGWHDVPQLELYQHMIVSGAWWDYVDELAIHRVGAILLRNYPKELSKQMRSWSKSADLWQRRTAIICQVAFKRDTDLRLLYDCIEPALESKEFFLRKAIGWALRQYAWTDAAEIKRYVKLKDKALSGLSKREALKNIT
jgi:3-methyladenine DNA glycosylase AlkD